MSPRPRSTRRTVAAVLLAAVLAAPGPSQQEPSRQEPAPTQTPQQPAKQEPAKPESAQQHPAEPIDPTRAAAEILKQRLGLQPGPIGDPPKGPPAPDYHPTEVAPARSPQEPEPIAPGAPGTAPQGEPQDPTKAAARALERLLPHAEPPGSAPIPNATGTPEPMLRDRPTPAAGGAATGARPTGEPDLLRGTFATSYRFRHGAGASDHNLTARLNLDIGREEREPFSFHFAGLGFANLDGRRDDDPFRGLEQSFRDDIHGRIYRAYFAARAPLPYVARLRLGRQDLDAAPVPVTFDGLCADSDEFGAAKVSVSAWGGIPVHHFEPSSRGDSAYGVGAGMRPWQGGRLRFDWQSLRDDFLAIERHDEVLGLRAWQSFDALQLTALHTWLNGRPREVQVGAHGELPFELFVDVDYRELLRTQRSQVNELDPFYVIAAEYRPYRQLQLSLSRDFGKHLTLSSGGQVRRLSEASDEGTFNRDFERCWADASFPGLFGVDRLTGFVNGSLWHTSGEATRAVAGGLQYRTDDGLRLELGSGYDLFRYDVLADRERVHVRTFYLRADYALAGRVRLDATYELERNDDDEFHLLRLGMTWTL